jgi:predicted N-formylglutamate amidohydrolase
LAASSKRRSRPLAIVLSCEHASNFVPPEYAHLFRRARGLLATHRGYDRGALDFAKRLAGVLGAPLCAGETTRLLADLNRTPGNPSLFSRYVKHLPEAELARILRHYHAPQRRLVETAIARAVARGAQVLHLAIHSFTPVLRGKKRELEVGLLYDPQRRSEYRFCERWLGVLAADPRRGLRVRRNAPYRGSSDGIARALRARFADRDYLGLELELNQGLLRSGRFPAGLEHWIARSFLRTAEDFGELVRRRGVRR